MSRTEVNLFLKSLGNSEAEQLVVLKDLWRNKVKDGMSVEDQIMVKGELDRLLARPTTPPAPIKRIVRVPEPEEELDDSMVGYLEDLEV